MVGQKGNDSSGEILINSLKDAKVNVEYFTTLNGVETGQAYIFSYPGDNSIVIYGAANMDWKNNNLEKLKTSLETCNYIF